MGFPTIVPYAKNIRPGFVGDVLNRDRVYPGGIKLKASTFIAADAIGITVDTAGAAQGATSIPIVDLEGPIPKGAIIDFGPRAAVVVVVGAAGAAADAVTVPVDALTGPLPNGTVLSFGTNKFARLTAAALAGAVSLTVAAIPKALVDNDTATYAAVTARTAKLTAAADVDAVSLAVDALPEGVVDGDIAYYTPFGVTKRVPAGTPVIVDKSDFQDSAEAGIEWEYAGGSTVASLTDDVVRILAYDCQDLDEDNDGNILRPGTLIRINHMYWSTLSATVKACIERDYDCTVGAPGQEVPAA